MELCLCFLAVENLSSGPWGGGRGRVIVLPHNVLAKLMVV